jgi:dienelactone hydrolase
MMEWVRHQGWADPNRIVAAGWSHGGWTTLDAMSLTPGADMANSTRLDGLSDDPLKGLVGAFVVYPYCGVGCVAAERGTRVDVPVKALVGSADVIVGNKGLAKTLQKMKTPKSAIDVTMLEGATHAFDEPKARDLRVKYDPTLTEKAHGLYTDFLKGLAGGASPAVTMTAAAGR